MITMTKLGFMGQLGNQMFQYAMLVELSARHGYTIRIPPANDRPKGCGQIELDCFQISAETFAPDDRASLRHAFCEETRPYDSRIEQVADNTDVAGYFQSIAYLRVGVSRIRQEFQFQPAIEQAGIDALSAIRQQAPARPLCGIHVRRGDYLRDNERKPGSRVVLDARQLQTLQQHVLARVPNACFVVSSDDLTWCQQQLGDGCHYLIGNSHMVDLCALSLCEHLILACSSFSWWAGFLRDAPDRIRICPEVWFPDRNINSKEICPPHWMPVKLECR